MEREAVRIESVRVFIDIAWLRSRLYIDTFWVRDFWSGQLQRGIDLIPSNDSKMSKGMMADYEKRKNGTL
jgi:hypothetical protein